MRNKCIIVRGVPGSGKSSFVRSRFPNILHLENDQFHYHNGVYEFNQRKQPEAITWCSDIAQFSLKRGMDVVISNTFTKREFIDSYRRIAELYCCDFEVYRMMGEFQNIHDVPDSVFNSMKTHFDDYEDEIFVYPDGNNIPSVLNYSETCLRVGDPVAFDGKIGNITSIYNDTNNGLMCEIRTEADLFNKAETFNKRIIEVKYA